MLNENAFKTHKVSMLEHKISVLFVLNKCCPKMHTKLMGLVLDI